MNKAKVEGHENLYRDLNTGAIVNQNKEEYQAYIANRKKLLSDKERIDGLETKVDNLTDDINDIKNLLIKALNK